MCTYMKTKGQQPLVAKLELLAPCVFCGGLAEWLNATGLQPADGASPTVQGFKSLTRRQISDNTPAEALRPYRSLNLSMRLSAVKLNRRFHSDVPQLQNRHGEGR